MSRKHTHEAPTAPRREKIKTPVEHDPKDYTSGIDTVEGRQSSRNANIDSPQQKYREKPERQDS
jgi:hypothetical protein